MSRAPVALVVGLCTAFGVALALILPELPDAPPDLALGVVTHLPDSGVAHPVTAVLLNFRAYDTLLEVVVLLMAALAARALPPEATDAAAAKWGRPVFDTIDRVALPIVVLLAVHLLLIGASRPGGAFHAAAVLTGGGVLLRLSRGLSVDTITRGRCAFGVLVAGPGVFAIVATVCAAATGYFIGYPAQFAGMLILVIEAALALSIAFALWALFP